MGSVKARLLGLAAGSASTGLGLSRLLHLPVSSFPDQYNGDSLTYLGGRSGALNELTFVQCSEPGPAGDESRRNIA